MGGDAADRDFGAAEVDQEAQGLARRPQVVPALREMHVAQRVDHLEFDDDLVLDEEVGGEFANDQVIVKDNGSPLLDGAGPALSHLMGEHVLVYLFNETMTERIGNPESTPDDPLGHRLQQTRIPSIHLHPSHPPCKALP
ncbi:MAG: hypothetical protein ABSC06_31905 [Rhodopila sp.]